MFRSRALDAKRKADGTADPARKAEFRQFEKSWLALAESYELTERLTDFTAENAGWRRRFNERRRVGARQDDEARLQNIIQEGNVEALFERMWLSSIVAEFRLFGRGGYRQTGCHPGTSERRGEDYAILESVRRGDHVHNCETVRRRKDGSVIDVSVTVSPNVAVYRLALPTKWGSDAASADDPSGEARCSAPVAVDQGTGNNVGSTTGATLNVTETTATLRQQNSVFRRCAQ
jgi:hypothetical protein